MCLSILYLLIGIRSNAHSSTEVTQKYAYQDSINFDTYKNVPSYIKRFLNKQIPGSFKIAEQDEQWNAGCVISGNKPRRQFVSAHLTKTTFVITYLQGGIGVTRKILTARIENERVKDYRID
jgi:hypothetical protein